MATGTFLDTPVPVTLRDGRTLITYHTGDRDADDLIVLECSATVAAPYWALVLDQLTSKAEKHPSAVHVVAYNRAGYGDSSPANDYRTLVDLANDLEELLASIPHKRVILVGHSWGGPIIRVAASRPTCSPTIAGLVLVDATDEHCEAYFGWYRSWAFWSQSWLFQPLALLGKLRTRRAARMGTFPEPYRTATLDHSTHMNGARAAAYELGNITRELQWLLHNPAELNVPVTVISAQVGATEGSMRASLIEAHKARAALAGDKGKFVAAEKSMHNVPASQPDLIAQEALLLLA